MRIYISEDENENKQRRCTYEGGMFPCIVNRGVTEYLGAVDMIYNENSNKQFKVNLSYVCLFGKIKC